MQVRLLLKFYQFLSNEKYSKGYAQDSKTTFPQLELTKQFVSLFLLNKNAHRAENEALGEHY